MNHRTQKTIGSKMRESVIFDTRVSTLNSLDIYIFLSSLNYYIRRTHTISRSADWLSAFPLAGSQSIRFIFIYKIFFFFTLLSLNLFFLISLFIRVLVFFFSVCVDVDVCV